MDFEAPDIASLVDTEFLTSLMTATIDGAGSTITFANSNTGLAAIVTDQRSLQRVARISGEEPDKIATILQVSIEHVSDVGKGDTVTWKGKRLNVSFVYPQEWADTPIYLYLVTYEI